LLDRSCIEATGPDAGVLLQSLLSNDVDGAQPGGAVYALLLTPKARVISDVELFNTGNGYVLARSCAAGAGVDRARPVPPQGGAGPLGPRRRLG
jgi:folate-binding Fe-S cluster repair protein YgfZ